ncbi:nuclear transport factor 2 family protein, partial [Vibrio parahaemolyticus]|nr:nuclear transport factor 2 family protein [Vibrio parahaemolyticus]NMR83315.1 nuclear transport factor 2 family protein [Vibrio parahaemolyticus]
MSKYQEAKRVVREYFSAMENATHENVAEVLKAHTSKDYL